MKYAYIDKNDNNRVVAWIDTAEMEHNLPPAELLVPGVAWPADREGKEYMLAGSKFVPYVLLPSVTQVLQTCTPAQGLVAIFALKNITEDDVLTAISQIEDPVAQYTARIGYQRATTWERGSPTMQTMAQLLQLSEADLDELFAYAAAVKV